ncbi:phosphoglycerate mutase family protein [Ophiobolus disseminans]|uniref:Phosphoglycerate mutase family protein n=1 Tax=Ophiobolus disseminans TaxID=1469910 RepID=A0A6A6ZQL4_9PLEO|nr:phosphoglycerate mutase family protein [Ophiobolus disseminans]
MADLDASTPRVFIARHGETEWTKNGRYTGSTELLLTPDGEKQVSGTASHLVGSKKLVDPERLVKVFVSPRKRAQQTFTLLFEKEGLKLDDASGKVVLEEDITEWDHGMYEGWLGGEIRSSRKERGVVGEKGEEEWSIWRDGCEGGESPQQVAERLDRLIAKIRELQRPCMNGEQAADVVVVAHGMSLRCFVKRWLGYPLDMPLALMLSPGAIGILSYLKHDIEQPAFFVGMSLPPL